MENFVYEYPTKVFFGNHGQGLAVVHPVYYKHIYKDGLLKFARFAVNVWGISPKGKSEEEIALAGIDALADFIKECGLPTHLTELKTKAKITEDMLKAVADSTNIIQTGYGVLTHEEIYNILKECIDREGKWYGCKYSDHASVTNLVLHSSERTLEMQGWVKVYRNFNGEVDWFIDCDLGAIRSRLTLAQIKTFEEHGLHEYWFDSIK